MIPSTTNNVGNEFLISRKILLTFFLTGPLSERLFPCEYISMSTKTFYRQNKRKRSRKAGMKEKSGR